MTHLTLIVPFSVPPGAGNDATDDVVSGALLRQLELPALGKLLTRASPGPRETHDDPFLRSLPQERWLAGRAGLDTRRVPTAPFMRLADLRQRAPDAAPAQAPSPGQPGEAPVDTEAQRTDQADQGWACLQPVHIHAARDHLVLMHPDSLDIRPDESAALRAAIDGLLRESGIALHAPHPARWYVADDAFGELETTTPVRATGRNIDIWLQAGARARDWRRLQNEIQMTWHDHPVNQAREAEGRLPVNSVWLHGGGKLSVVNRLADAVLTDDPFLAGLALDGDSLLDPQPSKFEEIAKADGHVMALLDTTTEAHIAQDWGLWLERMHALDADWFAPVLTALADGRVMGVTLVLGGENHYAEFTVRRADLRKFWRGFGARGDWRALLSNLAMAA